MKLNTKIAITILQVALIPWVLAGGIAYLSAQEQIKTNIYTELDALANLRAHWLEYAIQNKLVTLNLFSNDPELTSLFFNYEKQPTALARQKVQAYLIGELGSIKSIQKVFMVSPAGIVVASTDQALLGKDVRSEDYFKLGLQANDASTLKKDSAGSLSQYMAGPLTTRGQTEGVVVVVTDVTEIISIVEDYAGLGNTGETLLVKKLNDTSALFLTPTRFDSSATLTRVITDSQKNIPALHAAEGEESIFTNLVDYRGVQVLAATRYISSVGWGLVVKIDQSEAFSPVRKLGELFFLIIVISGLFLMLIGISLARSITGPINELTRFVKKVAQEGSLQESIVVTSGDEVGQLAAAFNSMIVRLKEVSVTLETKVVERTKEIAEKTADARNSEKAALNIAADLKDEEEKLILEKTLAENLANDLNKFKLALDNASDQVTITDPEGIVIYANAAVAKVAGYQPEEVVGKKAGDLWKLPMPSEYYKQLWHTIREEKKTFIGEIQNRRKNGEIYNALFSVSPVLDTEGNILFFVSLERDITKEKEMDKAKSEFVSLASHQMRTPLTAINWYTEMLLDGDAGKLNEKQENYFHAIYTAAGQMNDILKAFLHILRLETGAVVVNPVLINPVDIIKTTLKESQLDIEKKHLRVVEHYQDPLPPMMIDPTIMLVILQNLIGNAAKYTPEKGEITISLESIKKGGVAAGKTVMHDSLLVSIKDTGIGISASDHDKISTKFFRTESAKKWDPNGNGIGLYMTNKMVEILGGTIWFDSEEGKGTTFYVLIPIGVKKG